MSASTKTASPDSASRGAVPAWAWLAGVLSVVLAAGGGYVAGLNAGRQPAPAGAVAPPAAIPAATALLPETLPTAVEPVVGEPTPAVGAAGDPSEPVFRDLTTRGLTTPRDPLAGLDQRIKAALTDWKVPGCVVAVVHQDKVVYRKGFGVRRAGGYDPVDPQTLFYIASVTKGFTSMVAAMLVDEGKIAWDEPIGKHLPEVTWHAPLSGEVITLRDLLCHRTGLPRDDAQWVGTGLTRAQVLEGLAHMRPRWDLRTRFIYQNQAFLAAGTALGHAAGSDWDSLVATRILAPLGMKRTSTTTKRMTADPANNVASGHNAGEPVGSQNLDNCGPATSLVSCADDLTRWVRFLLAGGQFEDQELVSREGLDALFSPTIVMPAADEHNKQLPDAQGHAYGLGWMTMEYREERAVLHSGTANGQRSLVAMLPDKDLGVVVLANSERTPLIFDVMYDVFDGYLGPVPASRVAQRRKLLHQLPDAKAAARQATRQAAAGQFREAVASYDQALRLDPLNPTVLHGRAFARLKLGQADRAITDLNMALHLDPRDPHALSDRSAARLLMRDVRGALADANAALALAPELADAYNNRANVRRTQGDWTAVFSDAQRAIELNPELAGAWALRGLARLAAGQKTEAEADFAHCLKLAPQMKESLDREIATISQRQ